MGYALLIDCRSKCHQHTALPEGHYLVILDTTVRRELGGYKYNERRSQCEMGLKALRKRLTGVRALRDVTPEDLEANKDMLPGVLYRRCRHLVIENLRVIEADEALGGGDLERLGEMMYTSHRSLRDDYEVSCRELDALVEAARRAPEVAGARMTGAGVGGCTVNFVEGAGWKNSSNR